MPKCNFNKVALQLYWNCTSVWVHFVEFLITVIRNCYFFRFSFTNIHNSQDSRRKGRQLEINSFKKYLVSLWDQPQQHFSLVFFSFFGFYYEKERRSYIRPKNFSYIQIYRWSNYHQWWKFWEKYPEYLSSWAGTQERKPNQQKH